MGSFPSTRCGSVQLPRRSVESARESSLLTGAVDVGVGWLWSDAGDLRASGGVEISAICLASSRCQPVQRHVGRRGHDPRRLHLLSFYGADVLSGAGRTYVGAALYQVCEGPGRFQPDGAAFNGVAGHSGDQPIQFAAGVCLHVATAGAPFVLAGNGSEQVLARFPRAKRLCSYAALIEGAALIVMVVLLGVGTRRN